MIPRAWRHVRSGRGTRANEISIIKVGLKCVWMDLTFLPHALLKCIWCNQTRFACVDFKSHSHTKIRIQCSIFIYFFHYIYIYIYLFTTIAHNWFSFLNPFVSFSCLIYISKNILNYFKFKFSLKCKNIN